MDAPAGVGVSQPLQQTAARRRPGRQQGRQPRPPGDVGVHVGLHVLTCRSGRVDLGNGQMRLVVIADARGLQVVDLHRDARPPSDLQGLVHRFEQPVALGAHVGDVEPAVGRGGLRHFHQLVGGREGCGRVDEGAGHAERPVRHCPAHGGAHRVQLRLRRRSLRLALPVDAHRGCTHEGTKVGRRAVGQDGAEPVIEPPRPRKVEPFRQLGRVHPLRPPRVGVGGSVGRALAHDLGGDPLGDLPDQASVAAKKRRTGVGQDVDEAGGHHLARGVNANRGVGVVQTAGGGHGHNPAIANAHVAVEPWTAGPVHDPAVGDHRVHGALLGLQLGTRQPDPQQKQRCRPELGKAASRLSSHVPHIPLTLPISRPELVGSCRREPPGCGRRRSPVGSVPP